MSNGKDAHGQYCGSFRVPAAQAWDYPELEYGRTGNSIPTLLFDVDQDPTDWLPDIWQKNFPRPNWIVWRKENLHSHVVYCLARPVLTGQYARPTPQRYLARVGEYMAAMLKADAAYSAALAHNPMSQASRGRYRTDWMREEPYHLEELAAYIPKGWRRPIAQPQTVYGRNDALFRAGMRWSGKPSNWGKWDGLADALRALNASFVEPLGERELAGIIKSVQKIQAANLRTGQTQRNFSFRQAARGRKGGLVSGLKRYQGSNEQCRPWEAEGRIAGVLVSAPGRSTHRPTWGGPEKHQFQVRLEAKAG